MRSTWEEAKRLERRPAGAWLYDLIGRLASKKTREGFRLMSVYALLENQAPAPAR